MQFRHVLVLALLTIGAIASAVLLLRIDPNDADTGQAARLRIGYYMSDARLVGTGDDGSPLYRLNAREASQSLADGAIEMQDVQLAYDPLTEIPWDVSADVGRMPPGGNIIELEGNVVALTRAPDRVTTIRTDYLELDPDAYVAQTQRKVSVEHAGNTLFATGMRLYLREDRLQLVSNVNGKFIR